MNFYTLLSFLSVGLAAVINQAQNNSFALNYQLPGEAGINNKNADVFQGPYYNSRYAKQNHTIGLELINKPNMTEPLTLRLRSRILDKNEQNHNEKKGLAP